MRSLLLTTGAGLTLIAVVLLQQFAKRQLAENKTAGVRLEEITLVPDEVNSKAVFTITFANLSAKKSVRIVGVNTCCGSRVREYPEVINAGGVAKVVGEVSIASVRAEHEWHGILFVDVGGLRGIEFSFSRAAASREGGLSAL